MKLYCDEGCLQVFHIDPSIKAFHQLAFIIGPFLEQVSILLTLLRYIVDDMDIVHLLKLYFSKQPVQMDSCVVYMVDLWTAVAFLHGVFRVYDVHYRMELDQLIELLQHKLGRLPSTDVPYSNHLLVWALTTADLLELKAFGCRRSPVRFFGPFEPV